MSSFDRVQDPFERQERTAAQIARPYLDYLTGRFGPWMGRGDKLAQTITTWSQQIGMIPERINDMVVKSLSEKVLEKPPTLGEWMSLASGFLMREAEDKNRKERDREDSILMARVIEDWRRVEDWAAAQPADGLEEWLSLATFKAIESGIKESFLKPGGKMVRGIAWMIAHGVPWGRNPETGEFYGGIR